MDALLTKGVVVLPIPIDSHLKVPTLITEMKEILNPEQAYRDLAFDISAEHPCTIVLGGFGATGCPSLIHHPEARVLRKAVYDALIGQFSEVFPGRRLELLADRFSIRRKGTTISGESWHRDVGPKTAGDIIYGGWLNLDPPGSAPQYFSCIPGNILPTDVDPLGFAKIPKSDHAALELAFKGKIAIPPGHIILFDQSIAHKITGSVAKFTSFRQYFGWRITDQTEPVYDKQKFITTQCMPPLPSGQVAPMYAKLHLACWRTRLVEISGLFKPEFVEKQGKKAGIVYRESPGLVPTGNGFPEYTSEDTVMFYPQFLKQI